MWAVGANDRWQCSELESNEGGLSLIDNDVLEPLAAGQKANQLIPPEAAAIIRAVQRRQAVRVPQVLHIAGKNVKHEEQIKHLSVGAHHVLATSTTGLVFAWGDNGVGQLGLGSSKPTVQQAALVQELQDKRIKMTAAGTDHSLFLAELGQIYAAGFNEFGQLGVPTESVSANIMDGLEDGAENDLMGNFYTVKTRTTPVRIPSLESIRFVAAAGSHSLAISDSNAGDNPGLALYSWGWGAYGQLGHSKVRNSYNLSKPKRVKFREAMDTKIAFVTAGSKHTLCLDVSGRMWYFGAREGVGIASKEPKMQFEPVLLGSDNALQQQSFAKGFTLIDAGDSVNVALAADDMSVYCFGKRLLDEKLRRKALGKTYAWENDYDDAGDEQADSKVQATTFE